MSSNERRMKMSSSERSFIACLRPILWVINVCTWGTINERVVACQALRIYADEYHTHADTSRAQLEHDVSPCMIHCVERNDDRGRTSPWSYVAARGASCAPVQSSAYVTCAKWNITVPGIRSYASKSELLSPNKVVTRDVFLLRFRDKVACWVTRII